MHTDRCRSIEDLALHQVEHLALDEVIVTSR
jgi:hypothetical protein